MKRLLLGRNVVLAELNPFIWRIKANRPLIPIIINHAAVVHRAEGHNNCLQKLTASISRKHSICAANYAAFSLLQLISTSTVATGPHHENSEFRFIRIKCLVCESSDEQKKNNEASLCY